MPTLEKMVKQAGKDLPKVAAAMRKLRKEKRAR